MSDAYEYKTSIWNITEALTFYEDIVNQKQCDLYTTDFFCIAARKKYLTPERREFVKFGNTCMMNKTILKEYDPYNFKAKLLQADRLMDFFYGKDYTHIPRECMVLYMNINHTDLIGAVHDFERQLADWHYDLNSLLKFRNVDKAMNLSKRLKSIQNSLLKSFQDPKNNVMQWIDIDCDIDNGALNPETFRDFVEEMCGFEVPMIVTQGGIHVLINHDNLSSHNKEVTLNYEPKEIKKHILTAVGIRDSIAMFMTANNIGFTECTVNKNAQVPVPGTIQNGHKVRLLYDRRKKD